jgi:hypothetical protein
MVPVRSAENLRCSTNAQTVGVQGLAGIAESARGHVGQKESASSGDFAGRQAFLQPTHIAFFDLDAPCQQVSPRSYRRAAQFMQPRPRRLIVLQAEHSLQPQRAGAVLLRRHPPHGTKPNWPRGPRVLEDGSGCDRSWQPQAAHSSSTLRTVHDDRRHSVDTESHPTIAAGPGTLGRPPQWQKLPPIPSRFAGIPPPRLHTTHCGHLSQADTRVLFGQLCDAESEPDGIEFASESVKVARIKEGADYEGVQVHFRAVLARARTMQVDIGFGDVVNPGVIEIEYPTLLGFSGPVLRAYPKETVVAEKLEAVTALEMLNSRMKDFFDLWALSRLYDFDGPTLLRAIKATFNHRATTIEARPVGLEDEFANDRAKSMQWTAFLRRSRLSSAPARLDETVSAVREFAHPLLSAAAVGSAFNQKWRAGGSWSI